MRPSMSSEPMKSKKLHIKKRASLRQQKQTLQNLRSNADATIALAIAGSGTGIWDRDLVNHKIYYSAGWKAMIGYQDHEVGTSLEDAYQRLHPSDRDYVLATIAAHVDQQTDYYEVEHRLRCKDGSYKWVASRGQIVSRSPTGTPLRMLGTTTDISAMRVLSDRLQQSVELITSLTNQIHGLVFQYQSAPDGSAFFSYVSDGLLDIYELSPKQVADTAAPVEALIHADDLAAYRTSLSESATSLQPWHCEFRVVLPMQGLQWRQAEARPRRLPDGGTLWQGLITDITDRKHAELELQGLATTDFLTQLPNRRFFTLKLEQELLRIKNDVAATAAVLMCDLDHFKLVNDQYGHAVGDLLLQHFAAILFASLRKLDTVGRVGGEEFAVVLPDAGIADAVKFAQRVQERIAEQPMRYQSSVISMTVSIGIAIMRTADVLAADTLSRSDAALYLAKQNGRNRIEVAQ
jgi:diguanylate cyclase (GGDEF)-like protein/PAS domain S-box-containing protein